MAMWLGSLYSGKPESIPIQRRAERITKYGICLSSEINMFDYPCAGTPERVE